MLFFLCPFFLSLQSLPYLDFKEFSPSLLFLFLALFFRDEFPEVLYIVPSPPPSFAHRCHRPCFWMVLSLLYFLSSFLSLSVSTLRLFRPSSKFFESPSFSSYVASFRHAQIWTVRFFPEIDPSFLTFSFFPFFPFPFGFALFSVGFLLDSYPFFFLSTWGIKAVLRRKTPPSGFFPPFLLDRSPSLALAVETLLFFFSILWVDFFLPFLVLSGLCLLSAE